MRKFFEGLALLLFLLFILTEVGAWKGWMQTKKWFPMTFLILSTITVATLGVAVVFRIKGWL